MPTDVDRTINFKNEIDFYCAKKVGRHKKAKKFIKKQAQIDDNQLFENMLELLEDKDGLKKMPVRKFFKNTFGDLLNDAIFEMKKKQRKTLPADSQEIFTVEGMIKFVSEYLKENLPEQEREEDRYDPERE